MPDPDPPQVSQVEIAPQKSSARGTRTSQPWGSSETMSSGPGFQVRRLTLKPLQSIPSQWHRHTDEQWVIARGTARVVLDGTEQMLGRGQSINLPRTVTHSAENMSSIDPLEIIEVQTGDYLGDDDVADANNGIKKA